MCPDRQASGYGHNLKLTQAQQQWFFQLVNLARFNASYRTHLDLHLRCPAGMPLSSVSSIFVVVAITNDSKDFFSHCLGNFEIPGYVVTFAVVIDPS